jgi:hypothetical protein
VAPEGEAVSRPRPRLAVGLAAVTALLVAAGVAAALAARGSQPAEAWFFVSFSFTIAAFSLVGCVIALRRPEHLVGWLLATVGLLFALVVASSTISVWAVETGGLPRDVAAWVAVPSVAWVPALGLIGTQLPLRLPDGTLPSPRWRWFSRATLVLIAAALVGMATSPSDVEDVAGSANPIAWAPLSWLTSAILLVIASFAGGFAALVVRYRTASSHDRVQLRWVAFGGGVFLAGYGTAFAITNIAGEDTTVGRASIFIAALAFAALPISIGYAVLRHRLYDIDVVINRTLVYGALTATLAAVYLSSVLLLQAVLSPSSDLAVAVSTLAVAALFRPARTRIQAVVDRRFYRRRYDTRLTVEAFTARLRDHVTVDAVGTELRDAVSDVLQPAQVSLWLRAPEARR